MPFWSPFILTGWCWNFLHIEAGCLGVQNCCLRHSWWFLVGSETGCTILCKELNCLIFCGPSCIMDGLCLLRDMTSYRATMGSKLSPVRTKHMPMAKAWNFWDKDWVVGEVFYYRWLVMRISNPIESQVFSLKRLSGNVAFCSLY